MLTYATATNTVCTLASLAGMSARESRVIDNSSTKYDDVLFSFWYTTTMGTASGDKCVYVYFYGANSSNCFPSMPIVTGTDAAITLATGSSYNLAGPMVVNCVNSATLMRSTPISVGAFFGGILPPQWGFVVWNMTTGIALSATETLNGHAYQGIYYVGS